MIAPRRVWIAAGIYALVYFVLGADRYLIYRSGADLGVFTQSIASVFHGFSNTLEGGSHFTFHFSPILYAFAPLLWLFHSPLVLVAIQAIACALVAPPLYAIARRRLPENLAFGVMLVALLYPPLAGVTFTEFHEVGLIPATTLWLLWAVDSRRWALAAAFAAIALGTKEDQGPILAFAGVFGVAYYLRARDRSGIIFSAALGASALAVFILFFSVVRPLAGATDAWHPLHFYAWDRVVDSRGTTPWWSIGRPAYFLEALVPLAFACLFSPMFVLALPGFAECLLSHESLAYTMGQHYAGVWIPYVLGAFAFGIARIYARRPRAATIVLRTAIGLCIAVLLFASPTHWGHFLGPRTAHHAALDRALAALPPDAEVGTHDEIYAHLGFDPRASIGLNGNPRYALFDRTYHSAAWDGEVRPLLERKVASGTYHLVLKDDGVELYARSDR